MGEKRNIVPAGTMSTRLLTGGTKERGPRALPSGFRMWGKTALPGEEFCMRGGRFAHLTRRSAATMLKIVLRTNMPLAKDPETRGERYIYPAINVTARLYQNLQLDLLTRCTGKSQAASWLGS